MAVRFYLDKRANKKGDHPIRASISIGGERFITSSGYSIAEEKWNTDSQQVKRGCSNSKGITFTEINAKLKAIDAHFADIEIDVQRNKREPLTKNEIKREWAEHFGSKRKNTFEAKEKTIFTYMQEYTESRSKLKNWSASMHEKYQALANHMREWKPKLKLEDFTEEGLIDFMKYLQEEVVISGKLHEDGRDTRTFGMRNSTVKNRLSIVKGFLRWAHAKGYHHNTAYQTFQPDLSTSDTEIVFLDWEELMHVYSFPIPASKNYLDRVRDVFCFCCFTGLRYSDVANLKRPAIKENHIEVTTIKTDKKLQITLNDIAKAILKKYAKEEFPYNRALPVITNQRMNEYLKELGELCEINEPVTLVYNKGGKRFEEVYPKYALIGTHTARRTFISNAIQAGIPPQVVMKFTGHSSYASMKPYIEIADKSKAEAMQVFNDKAKKAIKKQVSEKPTGNQNTEQETLHNCITLWCYSGIESEQDPRFKELCKQFDLEPEFAISKKEQCQALAGKTNKQ